MRTLVCCLTVLLLACPAPGSDPADAGPQPEVDAGPGDEIDAGCSPRLMGDPARAARGKVALEDTVLTGPLLPKLALNNLWAVWGGGQPADYWAAFRARYGFIASPKAGAEFPWGIKSADANYATMDCLVCHAGEIGGQRLMGLSNTQLDVALLQDDLAALARLAGQPVPTYAAVRTGARGVTDAMGLGLKLSLNYGAPPFPIKTELGYQDAPAWWGLQRKSRMFTDGSGDILAHRSMMATLMAFGVTVSELEAKEETFKDIKEYLLTLPVPAWPFGAIDQAAAARGQILFETTCSRCHGSAACDASPSTIVSLAEVGTDPVRAQNYGPAEVAWVNSGWLARDYPERATGGYVAPPLRGVWATAPYFHNGSVPTLEGVLKSSVRPVAFRLLGTGEADYDQAAVGLKFEALAAAPTNPPRADLARVYDTTRPGLSNAGHTFGDGLSDAERNDLLEFLKGY